MRLCVREEFRKIMKIPKPREIVFDNEQKAVLTYITDQGISSNTQPVEQKNSKHSIERQNANEFGIVGLTKDLVNRTVSEVYNGLQVVKFIAAIRP